MNLHTTPDVVRRLRLGAFDDDALLAPGQASVRVAGGCTSPVAVDLLSRLDPRLDTGIPFAPYDLRWYFRCRRCAACRMAAALSWANRARVEVASASRTWFFTGTFDWNHSPGGDPLRYAVHATKKAFQRLRKAGFVVRYMAVFELHPGRGLSHGLPHVHCLIHDQRSGPLLHRRDLSKCWKPCGFSKSNLIEGTSVDASTRYIVKYVTKGSSPARIRASIRYGRELTARTVEDTH